MSSTDLYKLLIIPNNFDFVFVFIILGFYFINQKKFFYIGVLVLFSFIFNTYLKSIYQIPLNPSLGQIGWAYPSTHTVTNVVLHGLLILFFRKMWVLILSLTILITSFISMVNLGYHSWTDIIAGIGVALIVLCPSYYWLRDAINKRALFGIILACLSLVFLVDSSKQWCWKALGMIVGFTIFNELISFNNYGRLIRLVSVILVSLCFVMFVKLEFSGYYIYNTLYGMLLASLIFFFPFAISFLIKYKAVPAYKAKSRISSYRQTR